MHLVVDQPQRARLHVCGPEAASFLHRMSTNHVDALAPGEARLNVLTTDKGRIFDVVHHIATEDGALLIGTVQNTEALQAWLDRYFFTEKLELVARDDLTCVLEVGAATALGPWQAERSDSTGGEGWRVRTFDRLNAKGERVPAVLHVGAAAAGIAPRADDALTDATNRAAAGVPLAEMGEAHTPLDLDLHDAIHWAKGCYIGQEVIARLDTYGKQKKHLVTLTLAPDVAVAPGDAMFLDGKAIGAVTTVVPTALADGLPRALAVGKLDPGSGSLEVRVGSAEGPAAVARSPLVRQQPHD